MTFGWTGYRNPYHPGPGNIDSQETLPAGTWRHLAGTFDGTTLRLYVDGQLAGGRPDGYTSIPEGTLIGVDGLEDAKFFDGLLDEVRISNVARSAGWIATQYANQFDPQGFVEVGARQCPGGC